MKKISVIVPIYNTDKYLHRCIDSIRKQTYINIEIILVNDGSSDKSPTICDEYARIDNRIRIIHKENEGPSLARKDGVNISTGEYITFVDSDDYIDYNMYEILINHANEDIDIVQCGYRKVSTTGEIIKKFILDNSRITGVYNCALHYASQKNTTNSMCNRLFKEYLLKNATFPKLYTGEDSCILTQVYASAKQVVNIKECLYNYVMTQDSICRGSFSEKKLDSIKAGKFMFDYLSCVFPQLCGFSALYICFYAARLYCEIIDSYIESKQVKLKRLFEDFNRYYNLFNTRFVKDRSPKRRVYFIGLFRKSPKLCKW